MQRANSAALRTTPTKGPAPSCGAADKIVASRLVGGSVQPCSVMCGPGPPPAATESSTPPHESMSKSANRNEASDPSMVGCAHSCTVMSCDQSSAFIGPEPSRRRNLPVPTEMPGICSGYGPGPGMNGVGIVVGLGDGLVNTRLVNVYLLHGSCTGAGAGGHALG